MIQKIKLISLLFLIFGCTSHGLIGLQKTKESKIPTRIIWIQVPGLLEEHLAMLRFENADSRIKTAPEQAICFGKLWQYDLYRLRHAAHLGLLAQMNGTKNLKDSCEDYKTRPFWSYLQTIGDYKVGVLERGSSEESSFEHAWQCEAHDSSYRENVMLWKMDEAKREQSSNLYHFQEKNVFTPATSLQDKSCNNKSCYASLEQNARALYDLLKEQTNNSVLIIKDERYRNLLEKKKVLEAKEVLTELMKLYEMFQFEVNGVDDALLLLTSSQGFGLEMPTQGVSWQQFQKSGQNILYKRSSLLGVVYADGVQAQNFCGQYEESEIFKRILWTPKSGIMNLSL